MATIYHLTSNKEAQKTQNMTLTGLIDPICPTWPIYSFVSFVPFCGLSSEAGDHTLVDFAGHADVVEIVFANQIELTGLIEIKHFAALDV